MYAMRRVQPIISIWLLCDNASTWLLLDFLEFLVYCRSRSNWWHLVSKFTGAIGTFNKIHKFSWRYAMCNIYTSSEFIDYWVKHNSIAYYLCIIVRINLTIYFNCWINITHIDNKTINKMKLHMRMKIVDFMDRNKNLGYDLHASTYKSTDLFQSA